MAQSKAKSTIVDFFTHPFLVVFSLVYMLFQNILTWIFSPAPPPPASTANGLPKKRVAVIGAGLTGVSSAAHCIGHGFDVQLFEARPKDKGLGGIWSVCCVLYGVDLNSANAWAVSVSTLPHPCRFIV
jgi:hypothetical protein